MRSGRLGWLSGRRVIWTLLIIGTLVVGYVGINFIQVRMNLDVDNRGPGDAIVVLGAAQYDGRPSPVLARRLDHALELWHEGAAPLIVTTGSKQQGDRFTEGFTGFEYLLEAGVPESALLLVTDGASTWEQIAATARVLRMTAACRRRLWCLIRITRCASLRFPLRPGSPHTSHRPTAKHQ